MTINNKYEIGETVYLVTDKEQLPRMVTSIIVRPEKRLCYELSQADEASDHYEFEISKEVNPKMM